MGFGSGIPFYIKIFQQQHFQTSRATQLFIVKNISCDYFSSMDTTNKNFLPMNFFKLQYMI